MLEVVVPDKDLDPTNVLPAWPLRLPGFESDAFSIGQLFRGSLLPRYCSTLFLGTPLCMPYSLSDHPPHVDVEDCASYLLFQEEFDEACRFIARVETIISTVLGVELKFYDELLTLRDCYLSTKVNL
ncbi:unnamed protein product [Lactuca virosa]|uniref:Uncharacterized protein n=1 Tax=Lactuca virosa TaxID=75947 RepID=A0AAU9MZA9_9ASTR|nr:unnamed protein product [Lactuca virosa]